MPAALATSTWGSARTRRPELGESSSKYLERSQLRIELANALDAQPARA